MQCELMISCGSGDKSFWKKVEICEGHDRKNLISMEVCTKNNELTTDVTTYISDRNLKQMEN